MKLDRSKPFGKVSPPMILHGLTDRPACFEQNGLLFDAHDNHISADYDAGVPADPSVPPPSKPDVPQAPTPPAASVQPPAETMLSVDRLLSEVDSMPYQTWARHARATLGPTCPAGKKAILAALEEAKKVYEEKQAKRAQFSAATAAEEAEVANAVEPAASPAKPAGVDLAAWGRGQVDYLFGDVRKAAREQYNVQLSERRAVVDFLIEQKVITAREARRDV